MTSVQKYSELPGLDTAPDTYESNAAAETPDTDPETYQDTEAPEDESTSISSRVLDARQARQRFQTFRVDAGQSDFSDRLTTRSASARGYLVTRARRRRRGAVEELTNGAFSDDDGDNDEQETFDERLARLKREVEQLRLDAEKPDGHANIQDAGRDIQTLLSFLNEVQPSPSTSSQAQNPSHEEEPISEPRQEHAPLSADYAAALNKATALESRLASLEAALGLHDTSQTSAPSRRPLLGSVALLERQLAGLASTTPPTLEALDKQIKSLTSSAAALAKQRADSKQTLAEDDAAKIDALFQALPTIEAVRPLVPVVLDRLKTLRGVHATAANAAEELDRISVSQQELDEEIRKWREGLQSLTARVDEYSKGLGENRAAVKIWVDELHSRAASLQ